MQKKLQVSKLKGFGKVTKKDWFNILLKERVYYTDKGQPIVAPALCVTTQAEMLKMHQRNRKVNNGHAAKILASITTLTNILRQVVVVMYENEYYIADGQHLYNALKMSNLPIEFILCEVENEKQLIDFMRLMNDSAKRWVLSQFINVNVSSKVVNDYAKLQKLVAEYKDKVGMTDKVMATMMYTEVYNEGMASNAVKGGYFVQYVTQGALKKQLKALVNFYRRTNMTPTNYLNAAILITIHEKKDSYFDNQKKFLKEVYKTAADRELLNWKCGNKRDGLDFLGGCWARI